MSRVILIFLLLFSLAPVWFMFTGSLQDSRGVFVMPPRPFPSNPTLINYKLLLSNPLLPRWCLNTLLIVVATTAASLCVSCGAGYGFALFKFPFKKVIWVLLLAGIMIPRIALIVPLFVVIRRLGLSGSIAGVVLPNVLSPTGLYLARTYFEKLPHSIIEAARIDGAGDLRILFSIMMPAARPLIAALALFASLGAMQDYVWQMLLLQAPEKQTLLVGLTRMVALKGGQGGAVNVNPVGLGLAAGALLLLPLLAIFSVTNKYFTQALGGIE